MGRTPLRACSEGKWQNRVRGETASSKSYYFFSLCEFRPRLDCAVLEVLCQRIVDMFCYSLSLRLFFYCWSSNLLSLFCRSLISTQSFGFITLLSSGRYSKCCLSNVDLFAESILSYDVSLGVIISANAGKIK